MNKNIFFYSVILLLLFIILYLPVFPAMYYDWFKYNDNSHGILVPFISLFLIWKERRNIDLKKIEHSSLGLIIFIVSLLMYLVGLAGGIVVLQRLTIVTTLIGLTLYNFGPSVFSSIFFPLLFLFFMVPVPVTIIGLISFPLQLLVTKISTFILSSLTISVLREGNILHFANSSIEVAEACSGIRSLTAYVMLGFLFAYLMDNGIIRRILVVGIAIPLAFFVNILRVTGTGILAHFFGSKMARGFLHEASGLIVFALGFILLFISYLVLNKIKADKIENINT